MDLPRTVSFSRLLGRLVESNVLRIPLDLLASVSVDVARKEDRVTPFILLGIADLLHDAAWRCFVPKLNQGLLAWAPLDLG